MIRIVTKNGRTEVFIDGQKVERVRSLEFAADYNLTPYLRLEIILPDLVVESDASTKVNIDRRGTDDATAAYYAK